LEGYNDVLKNFSSTICELRANVAKDWTEEHINKSIEANITRLTRFESNNISTWGEQYTLLNAKSGVFLSSNLKIENEVTIEAPQPGISDVPAARTYIVQGGNLEINANIKYGETDYNNPSKIPSVAFIVIDGDIIIDASVTHIDGILMAVNTDPTQDKGQIRHKQVNSTTNQLTINGNLIGNVYDLFSKRRGSGDPTKDQGAVVIHYDERILLNTPPGISELIDLQQVIVPN